jgi:ribosomal-protein-alanine N-acetyltransferase
MDKRIIASLETERLKLRQPTMADAEAIYNGWASDPEVTKQISWNTHQSLEDTQIYLAKMIDRLRTEEDCYKWVMQLKESGQIIGTVEVVSVNRRINSAVIGFCMSQVYWNQGYMTEATQAMIKFLFAELKLNRLEACCFVENKGSAAVLVKCGLHLEGIKRQSGRDHDGNLRDMAWYALLKEEWQG